jgi:hypothetical protein
MKDLIIKKINNLRFINKTYPYPNKKKGRNKTKIIRGVFKMMVIDESKIHRIKYKGAWYCGYKRFYDDGDFDIEVYPEHDESLDVDGEVQDFVEAWFEKNKTKN